MCHIQYRVGDAYCSFGPVSESGLSTDTLSLPYLLFFSPPGANLSPRDTVSLFLCSLKSVKISEIYGKIGLNNLFVFPENMFAPTFKASSAKSGKFLSKLMALVV